MTKNLLFAVLVAFSLATLAPTIASASDHPLDIEWVAPTDAGGEIRLTFQICKDSDDPKLVEFKAYIVESGGRVVRGCWKPEAKEIEVFWNLPIYAAYRYKPSDFKKRNLK